ncbi:MAG: N,N-dimethylformamidase large subunit, partial [Alphaproteobacteria bacterium]|nr:N,N-dimethylformamidase large subunit [Alphaproteobacteria bacterium]
MNRHAGVTTATVLTGYPDRLSVAPGETVRFMVSAEGVRRYRADITRIVCGDINPAGPGFREVPVRSPVSGSYRGRTQACRPGSCVRIINTALVDDLTSFSIQAFVWPTLFGRGPQIILGRFLATARRGFALAIDDGGALALVLGDGRRVQTIASRV